MQTSSEEIELLKELSKLPKETSWVEFKESKYDFEEIGRNISALANSARLEDKTFGYIIFGINDLSHDLIGTKQRVSELKKGNEDLLTWIFQMLNNKIDVRIYDVEYEQKLFGIIEIPPAINGPVRFQNQGFVRIGSSTRPLKDFPESERKIWEKTSRTGFEHEIALYNVSKEKIFELLDVQGFFDIEKRPQPTSQEAGLNRLKAENLIFENKGTWNITNLAVILFSKDLTYFSDLKRRAPRVIVYSGKNKSTVSRDRTGKIGYAIGFENLVEFVNSQLVANEVIEKASRKEIKVYPEIIVREVLANALIHQDFREGSIGPLIEIFPDRLVVTNSGRPMTSPLHFIDGNKTRNDKLADKMREYGFCEERGSGIDRVITEVEFYQLPPPIFQEIDSQTKVTLFTPIELTKMTKKDKIRACYQHCSLKYISNDFMTNSSLRKRLNISDSNSAIASRIIANTIEEGLIKQDDVDNQSKRFTKYVPCWA